MPDQATVTALAQSPPKAPASGFTQTDRRRLRSARTKLAIIEAYMALLRESPQIPTATRIAERAGCSARSVFERFTDLHALRVAVMDHALAQTAAQVMAHEIQGDRQQRLRVHVETRAMVCERYLPLWRALIINQGNSAELKSRIAFVRQAIIKRIEMAYGPELATLPERKRHHILIVIESLIDFESWGRMREDNGLSVAEACAVWIQTIDRLLPPTPVS